MHPSKKNIDPKTKKVYYTRFSMYDSLGDPLLSAAFKDVNIAKSALEIGVGPSLFLLSTKSLSILFTWLTILNIPLMLFYYSANAHN
jgi:hypothetical protein